MGGVKLTLGNGGNDTPGGDGFCGTTETTGRAAADGGFVRCWAAAATTHRATRREHAAVNLLSMRAIVPDRAREQQVNGNGPSKRRTIGVRLPIRAPRAHTVGQTTLLPLTSRTRNSTTAIT